jgi:hypothetical protein
VKRTQLALLLCLTGPALAQFAPAPSSPFAAGTAPDSVAVGDFNGDGIPDLAVANRDSNTVTVLLGNGTGGFAPAPGSPIAVGSAPLSIAVADFNGDGKLDLAVANSASVTILLGNGNGAFTPAVGSPIPIGSATYSPLTVAAGDFNGDRKPDLAIGTSAGLVYVMLGDGTGGFSPASGSPFPASYVAVGDFNGDGRSDLALLDNGISSITVYLGQGNGGFTVGPASPFTPGTGPYTFATGDLNGDGKLDLAVANFGSNNLTVLLGNGSGGFTPAPGSPFAAGTQPSSLAAADFNGDGHLDLAVASLNGNAVRVLVGDGRGAFAAMSSASFATGTQPVSLAVADFNRDGKPDLVTANLGTRDLTVLLNTMPSLVANPAELQFYAGAGQAAPPGIAVTVTPQSGPAATYTATSNQNWLSVTPSTGSTSGPSTVTVSVAPGTLAAGSYQGTIQFSAPGYSSGVTSVQLSIANPAGGFTLAPGSPFSTAESLALGDFNGDGKLDILANTGSAVTVLLGNGSGGFTPGFTTQLPASGSSVPPAVGDFNGDGNLDFAIVTFGASGWVLVWLGDGQGGFTPVSGGPYPAGYDPVSIAVADFNGDGNLDLAIGNNAFAGQPCCGVTVLLGDGYGGFAPAPGSPVSIGSGASVPTVWAADFNGDGKPDIAVFNGSLTILLGDGHGGFQTAPGSPFASGTYFAALGDFNGDGKLDFAAVVYQAVTVWLGDGNGGFTAGPSSPIPSIYPPISLAAADFNGDGNLDLALYIDNNIFTQVMMMLGNGSGGFTAASSTPPGQGIYSPVAADFNADGRADLVGISAYSGDGPISVLLGSLAPTSIYLSTTAMNPVPAGQSVPLTANLSTDGYAIPTGTVSFKDGGTLLGNSNLTNSTATFTATLSPGTHNLTATYNGDTLTQASPPSYPLQVIVCELTFSPSAIYLDATSQASAVNVIANSPGCSWTSSAGGFITITSGATGTGNGTVSFTVSANTSGADRTGALIVGGETVSVTERASTQIFADVPPSAYYFDFTDVLSTSGITAGCSTNPPDFCPNDTVTREEMAVFIVTAIEGDSFTYTTTPYFTDVPPTSSFFKFIQKLRDLGITDGCSATQFCPTDAVTRAEMAAFIIRARYETTPYTYPSTPYFTDVPPSNLYFPFVQKMAQIGITAGCAPSLYCPNDTLPRGQMSVFIVTGLLNQFLAAGTPVIAAEAPNAAEAGFTATVTLTGLNTHFAQGTTQVVLPPGIAPSNVTVASAISLTVQIAVDATFVPGPVSIVAITGAEEAVLPNGFTVQ